jgi:hypothetical protein
LLSSIARFCFTNRFAVCAKLVLLVDEFSSNGELCLNCLSQPRGQAHLGAMMATTWALHRYLEAAGDEIDEVADTPAKAHKLALTVRHLVEQSCTDILRRIPRAYGPHPLAMNEEISRRYQEVDLYLRQSHAERDLESLGRVAKLEGQRKTPAREHLWYPQGRSIEYRAAKKPVRG